MLTPGTLDELAAALRRPASVARVAPGRPPADSSRSFLGAVRLAAPGERWPEHDGTPMAPLAQLDLSTATSIPDVLRDIALIAVFLAADDQIWTIPGPDNGDRWLVRTYTSVEGLVEVERPAAAPSPIKPRRLAWHAIDDLPDYDDLIERIDIGLLEDLLGGRQVEDAIGSAAGGAKVGGWPRLIQSEVWWPESAAGSATFALQIDSDEDAGLNLWDNGVLHVGRTGASGTAAWVAEAQMF